LRVDGNWKLAGEHRPANIGRCRDIGSLCLLDAALRC